MWSFIVFGLKPSHCSLISSLKAISFITLYYKPAFLSINLGDFGLRDFALHFDFEDFDWKLTEKVVIFGKIEETVQLGFLGKFSVSKTIHYLVSKFSRNFRYSRTMLYHSCQSQFKLCERTPKSCAPFLEQLPKISVSFHYSAIFVPLLCCLLSDNTIFRSELLIEFLPRQLYVTF